MKKSVFRVGAIATLIGVATMPLLLAHGNKPGSSSAMIGGGEVKVDFVGPSSNGRDVLSLLPPGGYWRMGADRATTLTTDVPIKLGTATVPKGSYTLVAHLSESKEWSIIVADGVGSGFKPNKVVAQAPSLVSKLDEPVDNMVIKLEANGNNGKLVLEWGTARLTTEFQAG